MKVAPVMKQLREVLKEARQPPGQEATATFSEVAARIRANDNVARKFEKGESAPSYDNLDAFVAAYAEATAVSVFDLWDRALQRAKQNPKQAVTLKDAAQKQHEAARHLRQPRSKQQRRKAG